MNIFLIDTSDHVGNVVQAVDCISCGWRRCRKTPENKIFRDTYKTLFVRVDDDFEERRTDLLKEVVETRAFLEPPSGTELTNRNLPSSKSRIRPRLFLIKSNREHKIFSRYDAACNDWFNRLAHRPVRMDENSGHFEDQRVWRLVPRIFEFVWKELQAWRLLNHLCTEQISITFCRIMVTVINSLILK